MSASDIFNFIRVDDSVSTAGQPTAGQLQDAAAEGYTAVINLVPSNPPHTLPDEAGLVAELGMAYHYIPVNWGEPTAADFAAFERALGALLATPGERVLIHCAANFRVTAFYALYAQKHLGWSEAQAEALRARIWAGSDYPQWEQFIARRRTELDDLPRLSAPARRALAAAGISRLEQLTTMTEAELLSLHGMGPKATDELRGALAARGLSLAGPA